MHAEQRGLPRALDALAAAAGLTASAPLLAGAAVAIKLTSPGPVFFRQERVGLGGARFTMVKLRTMRIQNAGHRITAGGDPRVTRIGALLRKLKIDELPTLWNVLRGDMALVGPRPEVPEYVDLDDPLWREALSVRPGVTDPVTLALRNEEDLLAAAGGDRDRFYRHHLAPWKLHRYAEYVRTRTVGSDLRVLASTLRAIVRPDASPPPTPEQVIAATSPSSFTGSA